MKKLLLAATLSTLILSACSNATTESTTKAITETTTELTTTATSAETEQETSIAPKTISTDSEEPTEYTLLWAILPQIDAVYYDTKMNEYTLKATLDDSQVEQIEKLAADFETRIEEMSDNKIDFNITVAVSEMPVQTLTAITDDISYMVDLHDLPEDIVAAAEGYDCVMASANLDGGNGSLGTDYWGLTYLDKLDYGWSYGFIQILDGDLYLHESELCAYPEEVWVHEWLHTLEERMSAYCFVPTADGSDYYNYSPDEKGSFYHFYQDILRQEVVDPETGEKLGMTDEAWQHVSD